MQRVQSHIDTLLALGRAGAGAGAGAGAAVAEPMDSDDGMDGSTVPSDRSDGELPPARPVPERPQKAQHQRKRGRAAPVTVSAIQRASSAPGLRDSAVGEKKAKKEDQVPIPANMSTPTRASSWMWTYFALPTRVARATNAPSHR